MFAVPSWSDFKDTAVITQKDGTPKLFASRERALRYAMHYLNFKWLIINLEG